VQVHDPRLVPAQHPLSARTVTPGHRLQPAGRLEQAVIVRRRDGNAEVGQGGEGRAAARVQFERPHGFPQPTTKLATVAATETVGDLFRDR
jgi:hypothetical protein